MQRSYSNGWEIAQWETVNGTNQLAWKNITAATTTGHSIKTGNSSLWSIYSWRGKLHSVRSDFNQSQ